MKQQPQNQALGASETTRFFCTRISSAAGAAGELKQHRKEPHMANRNIKREGQRPRCPQPQPETAENAKIKLSAKIARCRNQISTLLGVSPRKFRKFQISQSVRQFKRQRLHDSGRKRSGTHPERFNRIRPEFQLRPERKRVCGENAVDVRLA